MAIQKLAHYSIRTRDVDASRRFYIEVLGLRAGFRPPFNFPGVWLYLDDEESDFGVVHILGVGPDDNEGLAAYLGGRGDIEGHTGCLDHVAFIAADWKEMRGRLRRAGVQFSQRTVPQLGLHQVFLQDPSGVTIELNYSAEEVCPDDGDEG